MHLCRVWQRWMRVTGQPAWPRSLPGSGVPYKVTYRYVYGAHLRCDDVLLLVLEVRGHALDGGVVGLGGAGGEDDLLGVGADERSNLAGGAAREV